MYRFFDGLEIILLLKPKYCFHNLSPYEYACNETKVSSTCHEYDWERLLILLVFQEYLCIRFIEI